MVDSLKYTKVRNKFKAFFFLKIQETLSQRFQKLNMMIMMQKMLLRMMIMSLIMITMMAKISTRESTMEKISIGEYQQ